jgi:nanoRNase/pAp phosphatase (c-di-AMP/oligoRNAs hydrolase)
MRVTGQLGVLEEVIRNVGKGSINILIAGVDFDAVGSAIGLYYLLREMGSKPRIFYTGEFTLRQEKFMNQRYGLDKLVRPLHRHKRDPYGDHFALVDSSDKNDNRLGPVRNMIDPVIIIDHHHTLRITMTRLKFVVLDTTVSAASTLVIEMLQKRGIFDSPRVTDFERKLMSLMLAMGIYTDSRSLTTLTPRDEVAYQKVCDNLAGNMDEMERLLNFPSPEDAIRYQRFAKRHNIVEGDTIVASAGFINPKHLIEVSVIADELVKPANINLAIVYGAISVGAHGATIKVSVRQKVCKDPKAFDYMLKKLFGDGAGSRPDGCGGAMGGAEVVLNHWAYTQVQKIETEVMQRISQRLKAIRRVA